MTDPKFSSSQPSDRRFFVFGLGYSALVLARRLLAEGWSVAGTCQSAERKAELEGLGIDVFLMGPDHPLADHALSGATHILSSIPPTAEGDPVFNAYKDRITALPGVEWVGYLSTTGVYGDTGGRQVDETAIRNPTNTRSRYRLAAEDAWLSLVRGGLPVRIFRLAGIYGPGRSALDQVRAGRARRIVKPGHKFGRIHVDDIAQVLMASIANGTAPMGRPIYNLCDDEPSGSAEVVSYACHLLGIDPPPEQPFDLATSEMSAMGLTFWTDNRLISNRRIKQHLAVRLLYPNYRVGLDAIFKAEP